MVRNKLIDLNNILFEQLERLNEEELSGESLEKEISRTKSLVSVSGEIIKTQGLALKVATEFGLEGDNKKLLEG